MPIVQIAPVKREGMKLLISLFGMSQTGKTYSALLLAAGIEPNPAKRGLLDTEGGQRGRAYMDAIEGGYMYGALEPPFTPARYIEALMDFVAAGVTTLVVDSSSHAWFAEGGILDMVENATASNDMAKWAKPKRALGKLTNKWLGCGLHIILCARGKQPMVEVVKDNGKKGYEIGPVVPVQEKNLRFDMTIMAKMLGDGLFTIEPQEGGKCPGTLRPIFAAGEKMNEAMGKRLIDWIGGQDVLSPTQRVLTNRSRDAAGLGKDALQAFWKGLSQDERAFILPSMENLKSMAVSADANAEEESKRENEDAQESVAKNLGGAMPGGVVNAKDAGNVPVEDALTRRVRHQIEAIKGAGNSDALRAVTGTKEAAALMVELASNKHPALADIQAATNAALAAFDVDAG